ncbi:MAG: CvpA family protein [bacterium]|nr:CvpA family protein [bacterium]
MNTLDFIFLGVIFLSILFGVIKGFIRELLSLAFLIIAGVMAFLFYYEVGTLLLKYIDNRNVANFAGFISIFTGVIIIGSLVTFFVKKILTIGPLNAVDRILGGVFGLVRGILIAGVVVFGLIVFPVNDNLVRESKLSPFIVQTIDVFIKLIPNKLKKQYDFFEDTNEKGTGKSKKSISL